MEHIDWIVSFGIFIFVILAIITTLPRFLPDVSTQDELKTSKLVYSELSENINIFNMYNDDNTEINTYILNIDDNTGRASTSYIIDNNIVYGTILNKAAFYNFDSNQYTTKTLIFKESFIDQNNLTYLNLIDGNVIYYNGESYVFPQSTLESKNNYSNLIGEYIAEPVDLNIYFNYVDENNFSLCKFDSNVLSLYDSNSDGNNLIGSTDVNIDQNEWVNFSFKTNYKGEAYCKINDYNVNYDSQTSINSGKIIIKNVQDHYVSSLNIYNDNYLEKTGNLIETNYYDFTINNNTLDVNLFDNRINIGDINLVYSSTITNTDITNNNPAIIKDASENHKFIGFPNTKEFIIKNNTEDINFILNNNLNINYYNYEIQLDTDYYVWVLADVPASSIKTIYAYKKIGYTPETTFVKTYNAETNPSITVSVVSPNLYQIDINNLAGEQLTDYEIRISNDVISVISTNDSLFITDQMYGSENSIVLANKITNKYILLDFFDSNNNQKTCTTEIIDSGFKLSCDSDTYIKSRIRSAIEIYPTIKYNKTSEKMITYEKIQSYILTNPYDYYINVYNNKENIDIGTYKFKGNFPLLERISKYLNENGEEEIVKVLIKPN